MKMNFEEARNIISEIDKNMAELFEKRMETVKMIADHKKATGIPITDPEREAVLTENNIKYVSNEFQGYYRNFFKTTLDVSKEYQRKLIEGSRIAYQGVEGAFSYIAAGKIFPGANLISYPDFASVYKAVESGECDEGVLPVENSYAGEVVQVLDLMFNGSLYVNSIHNLKIHQNLVAVKGTKLSDIKKVISHKQALAQCMDYIKENNFETVEESNTAVAAKKVADACDPQIAAIASAETAALYGLEVIAPNINESDINVTRFAVISKTENKKVDGNYSLLIFTVNNTAGALAKALNIIGAYEFNMSVLRSRPMKNTPWEYYFYVELEGNLNSEDGKRMLRALEVDCKQIKVLGSMNGIVEL